MNCMHCGAQLAPGAGFCGACGKPQAPQAPPPQWQQQPPPQGQWQQPPPPPQGQWPQQPPQGQWPQQPPPQQAMVASGMVFRPYPIIMQRGMTRLTGHMFLAPLRLYFICQSQAGGLAVALGRGIGGLAGAALASLAAPVPGQAAPAFDEAMLIHAVSAAQGSLVMEPSRISKIKCTIWWRGIWFDGKTYALPDGLSKELKLELGRWCHANNVKSAGLT